MMKARGSLFFRLIVVLAMAGVAVMACRLTPPLKQERESGVVMRLPSGVSRFLGESGVASEEEKMLLPADTEVVRMEYRSASYGLGTQDRVEATLVLAGAERRSIHRPEVCLTGQGWTLLNSRILPVEIKPGRVLRVRDLMIEKKTSSGPNGEFRAVRAHYLYWFVGTDVTTSSHAERIWLTSWDSVTRNINHRWAYVSLLSFVTDNLAPEESGQKQRSSEETVAMMVDLIRHLVPKIQKDFMEPSQGS